MALSLTTIPVGRYYEPSPVAEVRTAGQRCRVAAIVADPEFDSACNNPFTPEVGTYTGAFSFVYYTKDGRIHNVRIGKNGNILRHTTR